MQLATVMLRGVSRCSTSFRFYCDKDWPWVKTGNITSIQELELLLVLGPEGHVKGPVLQLTGHVPPWAVSLVCREMMYSMAATTRATAWLCGHHDITVSL